MLLTYSSATTGFCEARQHNGFISTANVQLLKLKIKKNYIEKIEGTELGLLTKLILPQQLTRILRSLYARIIFNVWHLSHLQQTRKRLACKHGLIFDTMNAIKSIQIKVIPNNDDIIVDLP